MWKQSQGGYEGALLGRVQSSQLNCALGRVCMGLLSPQGPKVTSIASLSLSLQQPHPAIKGSVSGSWLSSYDPNKEEWLGWGWGVG